MVTSPGEKQLTQKMLEPPGKTVCAGISYGREAVKWTDLLLFLDEVIRAFSISTV